MKNILVLAVLLHLSGCASITAPVDPEYVAVARVALRDIERTPETYTLVVGPEINAKARSALVALGRTVIAPDAIPRTERPTQIPNYLYLSKLDIALDEAHLESMAGVVQSSNQGAVIGSCGVGSKLLMSRKSGAWEVVTHSLSVCTTH